MTFGRHICFAAVNERGFNSLPAVCATTIDRRTGKSYSSYCPCTSLTICRFSELGMGEVVLVMGLTGVGKSSFISKVVGDDIGIGHELESCK